MEPESKRTPGLGSIVAPPFVAMAAIPLIIGAVIFAPVVVPLALVCVSLEKADETRK